MRATDSIICNRQTSGACPGSTRTETDTNPTACARSEGRRAYGTGRARTDEIARSSASQSDRLDGKRERPVVCQRCEPSSTHRSDGLMIECQASGAKTHERG